MPVLLDEAVSEFLALGARASCTDQDAIGLVAIADRVRSWQGLTDEAEAHGLAPLLDRHCERAGVRLPNDVRRQLRALALRHRRAGDVYARTLREVVAAFEADGIQAVVLKGGALAHVLYDSPGLRPLSDIDLLVDPKIARRAQGLLGELGFNAPVSPPIRLVGHHHLPPATRTIDGHVVQIEIHRDAFSPDCPGSLTTENLAPLRAFNLEGQTAWTLDHEDMLHHLCRHLAERGPKLRLIWVVDVIGYALRYQEEIDWEHLEARLPFVLNALSLLHQLSPLPSQLLKRPIPKPRAAAGAGTVPAPLRTTIRFDRAPSEILSEILRPSDWWLRLYYGVRATGPLWWYRWVRHPVQVTRWLLRRLWIYALRRPEIAA